MKIHLIHISDIHFKASNNPIIDKQVKLFDSVKNICRDSYKTFIIISGDSAFSGKESEYSIAIDFVTTLQEKIQNYTNAQPSLIVVPGNHDCDFSLDNQARINNRLLIEAKGESVIDPSVEKQCTIVQKNYFSYEELLHETSPVQLSSSPSFNLFESCLKELKIRFYCYNTAILSALHEEPGKLHVPLSTIRPDTFNSSADLHVSIFHHPLHWLNPTNRRAFARQLQNTSNIYLTGHEHEFSRSKIDDLASNVIYHFEGSVLQDSSNPDLSEFNSIQVDLKARKFLHRKFKWLENHYREPHQENSWTDLEKSAINNKSKYSISQTFSEQLNDAGGRFAHPNKSNIGMKDIFIYPRLKLHNSETRENELNIQIENSQNIIDSIESNDRLVLFGEENVGKTTLLREIFRALHDRDFIPIYVDGKHLKYTSIEQIRKVVETNFRYQYSENELQSFHQENISDIFILIDGIDNTPIKNQKAKATLIKNFQEAYSGLIFTASELFTLEEILSDEQLDINLFSQFRHYEILDLNYSSRRRLITKWCNLGRSDTTEDVELFKTIDASEAKISLVLENKIVPRHPIFILILLQALESSNPHNLVLTSYGNYYQLLILKSLTDKANEQSEVTMYQKYCSEIAFHLFSENTIEVTNDEFDILHKKITSYENLDLPEISSETALKTLCEVEILSQNLETIRFKYKYSYYYFVANYLAQNISQHENKEIVKKLCNRLYRTEFANIVLFIIHFTSEKFILECLLENAKGIFPETTPCKLEDDVNEISSLLKDIPKLYLDNRTVTQSRDKEAKEMDDLEELSDSSSKDVFEDENGLDEDATELDLMSQLNLSFKMIEILGQVLENTHGSISGPLKIQLLRESYLLGLRTLGVFFSIITENTDHFINLLDELLGDEQKDISEKKVEKESKKLLFGFSNHVSYSIAKKVSDSIGTSKLKDKHLKLQEEIDTSSMYLVNFLIRLKTSKSFPYKDLKVVKKKVEKYQLSYFLLKNIVINYLQRNAINFKDKQRVCDLLNISTQQQNLVDNSRKKNE